MGRSLGRRQSGFPLEFTPYLIRGGNDNSLVIVKPLLKHHTRVIKSWLRSNEKISFPSYCVISFSTVSHALSTYDEVRRSYVKSDSLLLDRSGEVLHELRIDKARRDWTGLPLRIFLCIERGRDTGRGQKIL